MKKLKCFTIIICCMLLTTGCSDRRELNDIAIVLGWGMDLTEDGSYLASAQIAVPTELGNKSGGGGGTSGQGFFLETAKGKSATDASQNMQLKLSRVIFASHRRFIIIGEELARKGLANTMDEFSRNPEVRMRTDIFVVKGVSAKKFLATTYKLEKIPSLAPIKIHQSAGGTESVTFKNFLAQAISEGMNATLPIIEVVSSGVGKNDENMPEKTFKISGRAIFDNDLKMIGTLNGREARDRFWINNKLKVNTITVEIPEGNGNISFVGRKFGSKVKPIFQDNKIKFLISLSGHGAIKENNTTLDLKNPKYLKVIEETLSKHIQQNVTQTISHAQEDFKVDIFGLGETVHQKHPTWWKRIKGNWNAEFARATIAVKVNIDVEEVGSTGPPLHLRESVIKK
jgi:spore germination protein KC